MSKIKFRIKLTGLEIEFEGTNDQMKQVSTNLGQQLTGLIQPGLNGGAEHKAGKPARTEDADVDVVASSIKGKKNRKSRAASNGGAKVEKLNVVDFQNDISTYGAPIQQWNTFDKGVWLLYVISKQASITEMSATEIAETFNKYFRQTKPIRSTNVARDFGNKKSGANALVSEDPTKNPSKWFLTEEGNKYVQKLITDLKSNGTN